MKLLTQKHKMYLLRRSRKLFRRKVNRKKLSHKFIIQEVLISPVVLDLTNDETLEFLNKIRQIADNKRQGIKVDFTTLNQITPACALVLASEMHRYLRIRGDNHKLRVVDFDSWNEDIRILFRDMGMFDLLQITNIRLVKESYEDLTEDVRNSAAAKQAEIASKTVDKEKAFTLLMDNANAPEIANMCKEKISALTAEIDQLTQAATVKEIKVKPLDEATDCVIDFITKPLQIWCAGDYSHKQGVLNLCFGEQISYDKTKKFGTPKLSPIFAVFSEKELESKDWRVIANDFRTIYRIKILELYGRS